MIRIVMLLMILSSCTNIKEVEQGKKVEGNWIPEKVEWKSTVEGDAELSKIKYSSFYTFSFRNSDFILLGSTNTLGDNDSLILGSEPGYSLFYGKWKRQDSLVIAEYRKIYSFLSLPGDSILEDRKDTFILRNNFLIFKNEIYKPFAKLDTNMINSFWTKAYEVK